MKEHLKTKTARICNPHGELSHGFLYWERTSGALSADPSVCITNSHCVIIAIAVSVIHIKSDGFHEPHKLLSKYEVSIAQRQTFVNYSPQKIFNNYRRNCREKSAKAPNVEPRKFYRKALAISCNKEKRNISPVKNRRFGAKYEILKKNLHIHLSLPIN